jgi:hypothetical protein
MCRILIIRTHNTCIFKIFCILMFSSIITDYRPKYKFLFTLLCIYRLKINVINTFMEAE